MAKILVMEDVEQMRTLFEDILETTGHSIRLAKDGIEGMNLFYEEKPDLVITDIFMPEKDGLEIVREIRGKHPDIPIVAVSAGAEFCAREDYLNIVKQFGAVETLSKPFRPNELLDIVHSLLG